MKIHRWEFFQIESRDGQRGVKGGAQAPPLKRPMCAVRRGKKADVRRREGGRKGRGEGKGEKRGRKGGKRGKKGRKREEKEKKGRKKIQESLVEVRNEILMCATRF